MDRRSRHLIDELSEQHALPLSSYEILVASFDDETAAYAANRAVSLRRVVYGAEIFVRGLIEFSNYCKNDCLYCGIRRSNASCERFRLAADQIAECADAGYRLGFRTFVLQSGEDPALTDDVLCAIIRRLKAEHPDCAVTLSLGERSRDSYQALFDAGADRYLLRHETADPAHYEALHPADMSWENRMSCLRELQDIGYAVGCGFMVGSPGQGPAQLAADLKFVETFHPEMCGIGPFVPHHATPFAHEPGGTVALTCFLLSLLRLIQPNLLMPATTALGTIDLCGREKGILAGANVVMPNLSPAEARVRYELYDNKLTAGAESGEGYAELQERMQRIGYRIVVDRGDPR